MMMLLKIELPEGYTTVAYADDPGLLVEAHNKEDLCFINRLIARVGK